MKNLLLLALASSIIVFSGCTRTTDDLTYSKNVTEKKGYRVDSYRDIFIDFKQVYVLS